MRDLFAWIVARSTAYYHGHRYAANVSVRNVGFWPSEGRNEDVYVVFQCFQSLKNGSSTNLLGIGIKTLKSFVLLLFELMF